MCTIYIDVYMALSLREDHGRHRRAVEEVLHLRSRGGGAPAAGAEQVVPRRAGGAGHRGRGSDVKRPMELSIFI